MADRQKQFTGKETVKITADPQKRDDEQYTGKSQCKTGQVMEKGDFRIAESV